MAEAKIPLAAAKMRKCSRFVATSAEENIKGSFGVAKKPMPKCASRKKLSPQASPAILAA